MASYPTQGQKKIRNYIFELLKSDYFLEAIIALRKKYKIPPSGFENPPGIVYGTFPKQWTYKTSKKKTDELTADIEKICMDYYLGKNKSRLGNNFNFGLYRTIFLNLFYRDAALSLKLDVCALRDLSSAKNNPGEPQIKLDSSLYPVSIVITPYASERDVLDFVKKNFAEKIAPVLKRHADPHVNIVSFKTKRNSIAMRNEFIYENRKLPHAQIKDMVKKRLGISLTYSYIANIVSLETRKRKKV